MQILVNLIAASLAAFFFSLALVLVSLTVVVPAAGGTATTLEDTHLWPQIPFPDLIVLTGAGLVLILGAAFERTQMEET